MSEMRNPITREENFSNPAGNVMMELQEADLNKFVAGAGETRNSGGVLCTSTLTFAGKVTKNTRQTQ